MAKQHQGKKADLRTPDSQMQGVLAGNKEVAPHPSKGEQKQSKKESI
jgi:hypothetical protein